MNEAEKAIEKVIAVPAVILDKTVDSSKQLMDNVSFHKHVKRANKYWDDLGPGLTTGAADDDPSGIATYSQTGAQYGFQLLWLSFFTFPLMAIVQEMCARIGLVTGRGLAGNIRIYYPKWILYTISGLLFFANTLNLGADLGAMAKATQLIFPHTSSGILLVLFTIIILGLQIFTSYERYAKYLKWLALILFSYILSALSVRLNFQDLLTHSLIPSITFTREQMFLICAILGTTISPYLFFWQTSQEVEEAILRGKTTVRLRQGTTDKEVKRMRTDVWSGMLISNVVMFFIIAACAATLFANGITNITTTEQAALALRPIAGEYAYLLYALGVIGTGFLAIPILAGSASYALSESFRWKHGLYKQLKEAPSFYGVIIISMIVGLLINFTGLDPIKALIYSAVVNGLVAPVVLVLILKISSKRSIMGDRANGKTTAFLGWFITGIMILSGIAAVLSFFV